MNRREFMTSMAAGAALPIFATGSSCAAGQQRVKAPRFKPIEIPGLAPRPDFWKVRPQEIMDLCARGAKYIVSTVNFQARWDADARRRLWKAYERHADWYLDSCRREEKVYFAAFDKRIATRIWPGRGASCQLGRRQISVAPDGTYYPCVQFVGRAGYEIGHVGAGLDERSREYIFARNESAKPACTGCALEGRCNNRCGCLNISTTGSLDAVPPFFCEHERHVIPLADRLAGAPA